MTSALAANDPICAIVLDLDGTLVDSHERFRRSYSIALGLDVPTDLFSARLRAETLVTDLCLDDEAGSRLWAEVMRLFLSSEVTSNALPGVNNALALLAAASIPAAVVTGRVCPAADVEKELRTIGLDRLLTAVLTSEALVLRSGGRQTKIEIFAAACDALGYAPTRCAYVTDWPADLQDGLDFGFAACAGVMTGGYDADDFPHEARVTVHSSLVDVIDEVLGRKSDQQLPDQQLGHGSHEDSSA